VPTNIRLAALCLAALPCTAGLVTPHSHPNQAAQCPMYGDVAVTTHHAPQSDFCPSLGPAGNPLVGYTDQYRPGKLIVWAPLLVPWEPEPVPDIEWPTWPVDPPPAITPPPAIDPPLIPPADVPEPRTWMVIAMGLVALWWRRG
jgi:hypothetical protein